AGAGHRPGARGIRPGVPALTGPGRRAGSAQSAAGVAPAPRRPTPPRPPAIAASTATPARMTNRSTAPATVTIQAAALRPAARPVRDSRGRLLVPARGGWGRGAGGGQRDRRVGGLPGQRPLLGLERLQAGFLLFDLLLDGKQGADRPGPGEQLAQLRDRRLR